VQWPLARVIQKAVIYHMCGRFEHSGNGFPLSGAHYF